MIRPALWLARFATILTMASTASAQQSNFKHLEVASCSSSVCHGSVTPSKASDVLLNEYVTWSHEDAHSKAYAVLNSSRARSMAVKLGLPNAATAKICLDCHTDNVPPEKRGPNSKPQQPARQHPTTVPTGHEPPTQSSITGTAHPFIGTNERKP